MIFMAVPALPLLINTGLGKPLSDKIGILVIA